MILIISNKSDFTTHKVCRWLDYFKQKYIVVDDYPELIEVYQKISKNKSYFHAIWFRSKLTGNCIL